MDLNRIAYREGPETTAGAQLGKRWWLVVMEQQEHGGTSTASSDAFARARERTAWQRVKLL